MLWRFRFGLITFRPMLLKQTLFRMIQSLVEIGLLFCLAFIFPIKALYHFHRHSLLAFLGAAQFLSERALERGKV